MSPGLRLLIAMVVIMCGTIVLGLATMDCPPWRDCPASALDRREDEFTRRFFSHQQPTERADQERR